MVDLKKLRELVKLMVNNELTELDLQDETQHICLKRGHQANAAAAPTMLMAPTAAPTPASSNPVTPPQQQETALAEKKDDGLVQITSPMVGTFYAASSPDAKPFVTVGSQVGNETVVCLIEAMKVFNEIPAEVAGTIQQVLVESGQAVEFGQPLFKVKPN